MMTFAKNYLEFRPDCPGVMEAGLNPDRLQNGQASKIINRLLPLGLGLSSYSFFFWR